MVPSLVLPEEALGDQAAVAEAALPQVQHMPTRLMGSNTMAPPQMRHSVPMSKAAALAQKKALEAEASKSKMTLLLAVPCMMAALAVPPQVRHLAMSVEEAWALASALAWVPTWPSAP